MIHYHVWFTLKPAIAEETGLAVAREFMTELRSTGRAQRCTLLKNSGEPPKSRLHRYHALFEFTDDAQMAAAFGSQRERGIHTGAHGGLIDSVEQFHVEVFREV